MQQTRSSAIPAARLYPGNRGGKWLPAAVAASLLLGGLQLAQARPSFPCPHDGTAVEHWICESPALSRADLELARLYNVLLARQADGRDFVAAQRRWLLDTRDTCTDPACVARAYASRSRELRAIKDQVVDLSAQPWTPLLTERIERISDTRLLYDLHLRVEQPQQLQWELYLDPADDRGWPDPGPMVQVFCHPPDRREGYASRFEHRARAWAVEFTRVQRAHGHGYIVGRMNMGTDLPLQQDMLCQFGFSEWMLERPSTLHLVPVTG